jgi:hypothetical protein
MKRQGGNGSGKFDIRIDDLGGWVRAFPSRNYDLPDDLPAYLSLTLTNWLRERPQYRLRTVVPITKEGNTVELHAWFDVHVLPPPQRPKPKAAEEKK